MVLKIGMPHMEAEHEIAGLRFWNGDGAVRLLDADEAAGAMLLERCEPGTPLRSRPEVEQDVVIAALLQRLRKPAPAGGPFRQLAELIAHWSAEILACAAEWPDAALVRDGLDLMRQLANDSATRLMLVTDLHAGNVLCAEREAWLMIDPKPFVGDPAYDATQHLMNCRDRLRADPVGTINRVADLATLDAERVRLWLFARLATEPRCDSSLAMRVRRTIA